MFFLRLGYFEDITAYKRCQELDVLKKLIHSVPLMLGRLLADESPVRQSRIFCTRWNDLDMTSGLREAIDDVELEGCVIGQLQDAVSFIVRKGGRKNGMWRIIDGDYEDFFERI